MQDKSKYLFGMINDKGIIMYFNAVYLINIFKQLNILNLQFSHARENKRKRYKI